MNGINEQDGLPCPTCGKRSKSTKAIDKACTEAEQRELVRKEIESHLTRAMQKSGDMWESYGAVKHKDAKKCKDEFGAIQNAIQQALGSVIRAPRC